MSKIRKYDYFPWFFSGLLVSIALDTFFFMIALSWFILFILIIFTVLLAIASVISYFRTARQIMEAPKED